MSKVKVSVIIPAYNEESRLPGTLVKCIQFLQEQPYSSEIIVVTDGSKDKTEAVANSFTDRFAKLRVLAFPFNKGKGYAVKAGMLAATGDYRLFMDADYAVPIDFLTQFLETGESGYDIVIGSRALKETSIECAQSFPRRQLAIMFGHLQKMVLNLPFRDTQCGFKLFTADAAETIFPLVTYDCAYFDAELLFIAHKTGARVAESAVSWRHDQETRLPIGMKRTFDLLQKMVRIRTMHDHQSARIKPKQVQSVL